MDKGNERSSQYFKVYHIYGKQTTFNNFREASQESGNQVITHLKYPMKLVSRVVIEEKRQARSNCSD